MPPRADMAPSQRLLRSLRRAAGWPARRVLDTRVHWAVDEIDDRLDSGHGASQPVHARLDRIEKLAEERCGRRPSTRARWPKKTSRHSPRCSWSACTSTWRG